MCSGFSHYVVGKNLERYYRSRRKGYSVELYVFPFFFLKGFRIIDCTAFAMYYCSLFHLLVPTFIEEKENAFMICRRFQIKKKRPD